MGALMRGVLLSIGLGLAIGCEQKDDDDGDWGDDDWGDDTGSDGPWDGGDADADTDADADDTGEWVDPDAPQLQITPSLLNMGEVTRGCTATESLTLSNAGGSELEIEGWSVEGEAFSKAAVTAPISLAPGENTEISIAFAPEEEGSLSGTVELQSNDPRGEHSAVLMGTGGALETATEEWAVTLPATDIVFHVDKSGSMDDDRERLAANFSTFISELSSYTEDWQVIVTDDDHGCNATSGVLTPDEEDYVTRFQSAVSSLVGAGWWTEAGLFLTSEAVDQTDEGECNEGLLRSDAMLHLIMASDEPDQSESTWDWYVDKVVVKKGDASLVKFSAIAGPYPGGCATAEAGNGYHQAVEETGGTYLSICSDWSDLAGMSALAGASVAGETVRHFVLSAAAVESAITVTVNGLPQMEGWSYVSASQTVEFDAGILEVGDAVRIDYGLSTGCEG